MRWALALAILLLAGEAVAQPKFDPVKALIQVITPKTQSAPKGPAFNPIVPTPPKQKPAPQAAPESPRVKSNPPKQADRSRPKPKPDIKPKAEKPSGTVCYWIGLGMNVPGGGRAYVISEAGKRGHSRAKTEEAIKGCGY